MESDQENHDKHVFEWFFFIRCPFLFHILIHITFYKNIKLYVWHFWRLFNKVKTKGKLRWPKGDLFCRARWLVNRVFKTIYLWWFWTLITDWHRSWFLKEGVWWHPPLENFEISSPQKHDFRHSEPKSVCFNISFSKMVVASRVMNF